MGVAQMNFARFRQVSIVCLAIVFLAASGVLAANVQQLANPAGEALRITGWDANSSQVFESFEVDLRIFRPNFKENIVVPGKASTILVEVRTTVGTTLPTAPAIPAEGYLVVGSGVASSFLTRFKVGDAVSVVEKESKAPVPAPKVVVTLSGGSREISAVDRGRMTMELIVFTPDFGSHTFTNQYGVEVVVVDGVIVAKRAYGSTALQAIPANGYVLSGHNVMGTWLNTLVIGDLVELQ